MKICSIPIGWPVRSLSGPWLEAWLGRGGPELLALAVALMLGRSFWLALALSSLIRLAWCSAELLHGAGHALLRALVDGDTAALSLTNLLEHRRLDRFVGVLLPLAPIGLPGSFQRPLAWQAVGQPVPWKVRIKASGGLLGNLGGLLLALADLVDGVGGAAGGCPLLGKGLLASLITANGVLLLASRSDWRAIASGHADQFHCGNFGFICPAEPLANDELLPARAISRFRTMGLETEVRGAQAGGGMLLALDRNGQPSFVGHKLVNAKRGDLSRSLETGFRRLRRQAVRAGCRPLPSTLMAAWHYRFGTSGPPAICETHWHQWSPAQWGRLWQQQEGGWRSRRGSIQHRITHNGDFEGFQLFGSELDFKSLGRWLERVLHWSNPAVSDSAKISGLMDLLICQGDWFASVRWAYLRVVADISTTPSRSALERWACRFEAAFQAHLQAHSLGNDGVSGLAGCHDLAERIFDRVRQDPGLLGHRPNQLRQWIETAIELFLTNDPYQATRQFMERARGSFGLVLVSSRWPDRLVLSSLGQPITMGFDPAEQLAVYASEPAAVDAVLAPILGTYRIDLDQNAGEIAVLSCVDLVIHSMSLERELTQAEILCRRCFYGQQSNLVPPIPSPRRRRDPVAADLADLPGLLSRIKDDWIDPGSANRQSAEHLAQFLITKAAYLAEKQELLARLGLDPSLARSSHVDLLVTGVENSLWLGERFAADLTAMLPLLRVRALSANAVMLHLQHDMEALAFARQSVVLVLSHSGQTFASRQVAEACDLLVRQGVIRELFVLTGEPTSFVGSPILLPHGPGEPFCRRLFTTGAGRRMAEPATATVAATHQTLTELLFSLCRQVQQAFPGQQPLGMGLSSDGLMVLENMEDHWLLEDVREIVGADLDGRSQPTALSRQLILNGRKWALHVLETPLAWAIHALFILITVGLGLPLFQTLCRALMPLVGLAEQQGRGALLLAASLVADIGLYVFGPWCWTVVLRLAQGRQPLARTGRRSLVIGEAPGVHQLLENYVSKLFALSFGVTALEVHGADPVDHLLHLHAHRVVRGTLLFLGIPDGRCSERQRAAESAVILAARQADGIRHLGSGPEIMALGSNSRIVGEPFTTTVVLPSPIHAGCGEGERLHSDALIEAIRESRFGSFRRLLASYVFFWAMARRVAGLPLLGFDWWKSQSRTKVMTTASPVSAARLDRAEHQEIAQLGFDALAHQEQS